MSRQFKLMKTRFYASFLDKNNTGIKEQPTVKEMNTMLNRTFNNLKESHPNNKRKQATYEKPKETDNR